MYIVTFCCSPAVNNCLDSPLFWAATCISETMRKVHFVYDVEIDFLFC